MSKKSKKKNKKKITELSKKNIKNLPLFMTTKNIKCLKKGKAKVDKDTVIFLDDDIKNSIASSVINVSDAIIPESVESGNEAVTTLFNLSVVDAYYKYLEVNTDTPTFVFMIPQKHIGKAFDYMHTNGLGELLRVSTLPAVYSMLKNKWTELLSNRDANEFKVLYVPNINIFIDNRTGETLKSPKYVNVLIVTGGDADEYKEYSVDNTDETVYEGDVAKLRDLIRNTTMTASSLKCKNLIVDPLGIKLFKKNPVETSNAWKDSGVVNLKEFDTITYAVEDETSAIIFSGKITE